MDTTGWPSVVGDLLHRVERDLVAVLTGIDPDLLDRAIVPGANTIGWLAWHLTRSNDRNLGELAGQSQLWLADGWAQRFGRPADPGDTGFAHSAAEVARFRTPGPDLLIAYHAATVAVADRYLARVDQYELSRETVSPTLHDTRTVQQRLVGVITEGMQHVGQMAYLKGVLST
jgi:hypothetical protein